VRGGQTRFDEFEFHSGSGSEPGSGSDPTGGHSDNA
jgi:hypothetical protein